VCIRGRVSIIGDCDRKFQLKVPSNEVVIPLVRNFVGTVAELAGFDAAETPKIQDAAAEAASNVILHAYEPGEDASFDVICEPTPLGLNVIIRDMGMPFDPSLNPECPVDGHEKGPGICLMKRSMDEVSFHNLGKGGKETHLFKHLYDKPIGGCMTAGEREEAERARAEEPLPKGSVPYTVRRMAPEEAVEVSKCAYAAYRYTYFYEYMYYPERIRISNESGEMISYVAVTSSGEVMGHAALQGEKDRSVAELMAGFVKPRYRGQGCLNSLIGALIEEGKNRGFAGLYARAVTSHPYSQKTVLKYGFRACCLFLAQHDPLHFLEIDTGKRDRESMLFAFLYLSPPGSFRIYPPPRHAKTIMQLYNELGARPERGRERADLPQARSSVRVTAEPYDAARIEVLQYGADVVDEVKRRFRELLTGPIEAVYLFLNLCDPLTAEVAGEFEEMGFFFAGINPGAAGTDLLVLQYLNNITVDYDRLQFAADEGRRIADYVRLHDPGAA
jgi:anti-sigma regulatory factor (Ser/Thr protein kinase)/GNAT superfamily N-acetyltransferase